MRLARQLVERRAGVRYHLARLQMPLLRAAFGYVGDRTVVVAPATLTGTERISLGADIIVRDGVWLATEGDGSALAVGDGTYIGHRCHLHSIDPVSIGRRCVIADNVMISSSDHDREVRSRVHGTGPVVIGDDVFIGQNAVVLGGVSVGSGATVAAGAVVIDDVPAGAVVGGVPARVIRDAP